MKMILAILIGLFMVSLIYVGVTSCTYNETVNNYYYPIELPQSEMSVKEVELLKIINDYRHEKGLSKLVPEVLATKVAYLNNVRMIDSNILDHSDNYARKVATKSKRYSEIAGKGYNTAYALFQAYLNSPTHKAVIDREDMTHLSISTKGLYNTCIFTNYE